MTISGSTFGATQGTSTVTFNGTTATPTSWSATSIAVPVPANATTGPVVVTVSGQASNGAAFTVTPKISSLSPTSGGVGTSVTISGTTFGSTQGTSTVTFNGTRATPTSWSATSIAASVPAAATTGPVIVTVSGQASNAVTFTVTPKITGLSPTSGTAGTSVTISGTTFGATQGTSSVTFNGTTATPTTWSATSIAVPVPANATTGLVVVTVSGQASNGVTFAVTPKINSLAPTSGAVGTSVTISGTTFGATQGTSTVTFNGTAATPTTWSATSIAVPVPANATTGPVVVTVSGQASNGSTFTVTPKIDTLSPSSGGIADSVTINGTAFGATQGTSTVTFNGTTATPTSWSATSITVLVPVSATTGPVVVTVAGQASNSVTFTVTPKIDSLSPASGVVGTSVTISGTTFGATQGTSTVTFNGTNATPTSWSATTIVAWVPAGTTSGVVVVTVGGAASNGVTFTMGPEISSLSPSSGAVGDSVTISGTSFGASQGSSTVTFNGTNATPTSWSATSIVTLVPSGSTTGPVIVSVGGTASNGATFTIGPKINSLSPTFGVVGAAVTISGTTFGSTQGSSSVSFNGTATTPTSWTATSIVAPVPSGATTGSVVVTVSGSASNGITFTVTTPGTIVGKITKSDGTTPIAGATVKVSQGATILATVTTNSTGDYTVTSIAPGAYSVTASAAGYGTRSQNSATVNSGATTTVNLSLDSIVAGPVSYIYDAAGRLISTVGPTDTVTYTYDATGNLLSVSRQSSSQLSIINVVPNSGPVGATVTIYGSGFSSVANENTVQFGGVAATIISATPTQIVTTVPPIGSTGLIQIAVTAPGGTVTAPFTVVPASSQPTIQVSPANISIAPGNKVQFTATLSGLVGDQSIKWSVNSVDGGNSSVGTVSASGYYSAPSQASSTSVYTIRAISIANPSVFGQAQVAVLNPAYAEAVISRSVSVQRPQLTATARTSVSVRKTPTVRVAPITMVSVRRAPQTIRFGSTSATVSVTTGPQIQSVSPASGSKGATFTLTITGVNLLGATGLSFITAGGAIDANVTASGISVNPDGTSLTATVTINSSAVLGRRIIVVTTPSNHSLAVDVSSNTIEVIQ